MKRPKFKSQVKRRTVNQALRSIRDCGEEIATCAGDLIHILGEGGSKPAGEVLSYILAEGVNVADWAKASLDGRSRISEEQRRRERKFHK